LGYGSEHRRAAIDGGEDCDAIVALVYDPTRRITNSKELEHDPTLRTEYGLSFTYVAIKSRTSRRKGIAEPPGSRH
jgi:hypothetical protein